MKANTPAVIALTNKDATAEEFDSTALKVEKVVAGNSSGNVRIRALAPGRYPFMGEYHSATAQGVVVAENNAAPALLIVFREVIEAGLIVGIVLAATKGVPARLRGCRAGRVWRAFWAPAWSPLLRANWHRCSRAPARNCSMPRSCFWRW